MSRPQVKPGDVVFLRANVTGWYHDSTWKTLVPGTPLIVIDVNWPLTVLSPVFHVLFRSDVVSISDLTDTVCEPA